MKSEPTEARWLLDQAEIYRLREDFDLNANALSVALPLIQRIHKFEAQLRELQSQFAHQRRKD